MGFINAFTVLALSATTVLAYPGSNAHDGHRHLHHRSVRRAEQGLPSGGYSNGTYPTTTYSNEQPAYTTEDDSATPIDSITSTDYITSTRYVTVTVYPVTTTTAASISVSAVPAAPSTNNAAVDTTSQALANNPVCMPGSTKTVYSTTISYVTVTGGAGTSSGTSAAVSTTSEAPSTYATTTTSAVSVTTASSAGNAAGQFYSTGNAATTFATSTTSAPAATYSAGGSGGAITSNKKGLSYSDVSMLNLFDNSGSSWVYNWGLSKSASIPSNLEFVPMCWGRKDLNDCATKVIESGAKYMLSFNEPDHPDQANIGAAEAASLHKQFSSTVAEKGIKIGSPAVTNGEDSKGMGIGYLSDFVKACNGQCNLDFLVVHWYWEASSDEDFQTRFVTFVNRAIDLAKTSTTSGQVWITEFSNQGSEQQNVEFVKKATAWLDSNPSIGRYAYFLAGSGDGLGMVTGSALNAVGQAYSTTS